MKENYEAPSAETDGASGRPVDGIFPESGALITLFVLFFLVGLVILMLTVIRADKPSEHIEAGTTAYRPEDFPEVPFGEPLLPAVAERGPGTSESEEFNVPPPPFSDGIYPCTDCHADMEPDPTPRELEDFHDDIELDHGPADRWCTDCHNLDDRDTLRLVDGTLIGFDESYKLCGQCHGTIYRDWREGIHGRRRGFWNGAKSYLLCAHCHNPHAPKYQPMEPLPPPVRPDFLRSADRPQAPAESGTKGES